MCNTCAWLLQSVDELLFWGRSKLVVGLLIDSGYAPGDTGREVDVACALDGITADLRNSLKLFGQLRDGAGVLFANHVGAFEIAHVVPRASAESQKGPFAHSSPKMMRRGSWRGLRACPPP